MFEIKHLKTLTTLASTGNIRKTAEVLFTSQSALSHQIKDLEQRLDSALFIRNTSPVEFTPAGKLLLNLAKEIFPAIEQAKRQLKSPREQQSLKLAIECHACFQWLLPVTGHFAKQHQAIEIEFADDGFSKANSIQQADILFTDQRNDHGDFYYQEIGKFEVVAVFAKSSACDALQQNYIAAKDFSRLTLLTYPLPPEQLDVFTLFLNQAKVVPAKVKQVSNSHVMLQMVAANMGVATLPDWLVSSLTQQSLVQSKRLGKQGVFKTLYARYHQQSAHLATIEQLLPMAIQAFTNLYQSK